MGIACHIFGGWRMVWKLDRFVVLFFYDIFTVSHFLFSGSFLFPAVFMTRFICIFLCGYSMSHFRAAGARRFLAGHLLFPSSFSCISFNFCCIPLISCFFCTGFFAFPCEVWKEIGGCDDIYGVIR